VIKTLILNENLELLFIPQKEIGKHSLRLTWPYNLYKEYNQLQNDVRKSGAYVISENLFPAGDDALSLFNSHVDENEEWSGCLTRLEKICNNIDDSSEI